MEAIARESLEGTTLSEMCQSEHLYASTSLRYLVESDSQR